MINIYNSAKNVLDFYLKKLEEDINNPNAQYAIHYADLKLLKFRTSAILDAIESYDIEVS